MKNLFLLLLFFALIATLPAQELSRKGSLGVMFTDQKTETGVLLEKVLDNTTASSMGLRLGDIILSINNTPVNTIPDVLAVVKNWRAGQSVKVNILREERKMQLEGRVQSRPQERPAVGSITYGSVPFEGGQLRSILNLPNGKTKPPVVFYLQGFSCSSIDLYYDNDATIRQFVEGLVKEGFAVYRVEKPGMGDSQGTPDCVDIGYHQEVDAFLTALKHLKTIQQIDADNIFLFGHSLGGVTAPLIAAESPVRGIINYGSVVISWHEYLLKVLREQEVYRGTDYVTIEQDVRARTPLLYEYMVEKKSPTELEKKEAYRELIRTGLPLWDGETIIGRHYTFMQEINDANVPAALQKANCEVLAIHGEFDVHAVDAEWAVMTADIVNSFYPGQGSYHILAGTEHGFAKVPSMEKYMQMRSDGTFNGDYMKQHFNPKLITTISEWINQVNKMAANG